MQTLENQVQGKKKINNRNKYVYFDMKYERIYAIKDVILQNSDIFS